MEKRKTGKELRRSRKDALIKRQKEKEQIKPSGKSFFRTDLQDVNFWTPKDGKHYIDIIPFLMGPNSPVYRGKVVTPEGEDDYMVEAWVHYGIGPGEDESVICLAQMYEKKCP